MWILLGVAVLIDGDLVEQLSLVVINIEGEVDSAWNFDIDENDSLSLLHQIFVCSWIKFGLGESEKKHEVFYNLLSVPGFAHGI